MVKALPFTAAFAFCLLSFVVNIEHVLSTSRSPQQHGSDYDDFEGPRDYERELQSMVRRVEPLMAVLRSKQRDIESNLDRVNAGYQSNSIRNYDQQPRPATPNNFINRLDQHASATMGTPSILPFNGFPPAPGVVPNNGLMANALAMLNPNIVKRQGYGGGSYGGGYGGVSYSGAGCHGSLCGQNSQHGGQFSTLGLVAIVATALLYLLFFYYISTSTTSTGRRNKRAHHDDAGQQLEDEFEFLDDQDIGIALISSSSSVAFH